MVPGSGTSLRLVLLDAMPPLDRFPRVQDCASYGRRVQGARASAGTRLGTAGANIGPAPLQGAYSDAALLVVRNTPAGHSLLARGEHKQDQGKALRLLAHTRARAVYAMRKRTGAWALALLLQASGSRAHAPAASRDVTGMRLPCACR